MSKETSFSRNLPKLIPCLLILAFLASCGGMAEREKTPVYEGPVKVGKPFPTVTIDAALTAGERDYLGLEEQGTFTLQDIDATLLVVEFLNVYCVSCNIQVPTLEEIFGMENLDPGLDARVKIIGIAAGNNAKEIATFKEEKSLTFPIVPDPEYTIYAHLEPPERTPFMVFVRRLEGIGEGEMVAGTHRGAMKKAETIRALVDENHRATKAMILARALSVVPEKRKLKSPLNEEEQAGQIRRRLEELRGGTVQTTKVALAKGGELFVSEISSGDWKEILFTKMAGSVSVCDICHDLFFFYTFDGEGTIIDIDSISLTKRYNVEWTVEDMEKTRKRVTGRTILKPLVFDPEVDAVATGTITSSIVFRELNEAKSLFEELGKSGNLSSPL